MSIKTEREREEEGSKEGRKKRELLQFRIIRVLMEQIQYPALLQFQQILVSTS
jgi:hypothetical protein